MEAAGSAINFNELTTEYFPKKPESVGSVTWKLLKENITVSVKGSLADLDSVKKAKLEDRVVSITYAATQNANKSTKRKGAAPNSVSIRLVAVNLQSFAPGYTVAMPILVYNQDGTKQLYLDAKEGKVHQIHPKNMMNEDGSVKSVKEASNAEAAKLFGETSSSLSFIELDKSHELSGDAFPHDVVHSLRVNVCKIALKGNEKVPAALLDAERFKKVDFTGSLVHVKRGGASTGALATINASGEVDKSEITKSILEDTSVSMMDKYQMTPMEAAWEKYKPVLRVVGWVAVGIFSAIALSYLRSYFGYSPQCFPNGVQDAVKKVGDELGSVASQTPLVGPPPVGPPSTGQFALPERAGGGFGGPKAPVSFLGNMYRNLTKN